MTAEIEKWVFFDSFWSDFVILIPLDLIACQKGMENGFSWILLLFLSSRLSFVPQKAVGS